MADVLLPATCDVVIAWAVGDDEGFEMWILYELATLELLPVFKDRLELDDIIVAWFSWLFVDLKGFTLCSWAELSIEDCEHLSSSSCSSRSLVFDTVCFRGRKSDRSIALLRLRLRVRKLSIYQYTRINVPAPFSTNHRWNRQRLETECSGPTSGRTTPEPPRLPRRR